MRSKSVLPSLRHELLVKRLFPFGIFLLNTSVLLLYFRPIMGTHHLVENRLFSFPSREPRAVKVSRSLNHLAYVGVLGQGWAQSLLLMFGVQ